MEGDASQGLSFYRTVCNHTLKINSRFQSGGVSVESWSVYSKRKMTFAHETKPGTEHPWVKYVRARSCTSTPEMP